MPVNTVASSLYIILSFFFKEMDRRKISIFTWGIGGFAYPPNYSSNPETFFDHHLKEQRQVAKFYPVLTERVSEGGRF